MCGRTWSLGLSPLGYEGDYIPEGAVLTGDEQNRDSELTELEIREAEESFAESLDSFMKGE
jgi:hypothetical protein